MTCGLAIAVCSQILVDAAAAADELGLRARSSPACRASSSTHSMPCFSMYLLARLAGRNVDAFAAAVEDLRLVPLGVDLDFVVVGRLAWRDLAR